MRPHARFQGRSALSFRRDCTARNGKRTAPAARRASECCGQASSSRCNADRTVRRADQPTFPNGRATRAARNSGIVLSAGLIPRPRRAGALVMAEVVPALSNARLAASMSSGWVFTDQARAVRATTFPDSARGRAMGRGLGVSPLGAQRAESRRPTNDAMCRLCRKGHRGEAVESKCATIESKGIGFVELMLRGS